MSWHMSEYQEAQTYCPSDQNANTMETMVPGLNCQKNAAFQLDHEWCPMVADSNPHLKLLCE
jgi:hypothetical protein